MSVIIGIDEAGRGPIAGPVSVGVVRVEEGFDILGTFPGLNDSKQLSEKRREVLFGLLEEEVAKGTVAFSVELRSAKAIDTDGIVPSIQNALDTALGSLFAISESTNGKVFLDGSLHARKEYVQETVIGGDGIIPVIMLASVAAKVVRDRHMVREIASRFPVYNFEKHKGYGTKAHYEAIATHGLCEEHRRSYLKRITQS